jgi:hypothetical protein
LNESLSINDYKDYLDYLVNEIGSRPSGSIANEEAIVWINNTIMEESAGRITTWLVGPHASLVAHLPAVQYHPFLEINETVFLDYQSEGNKTNKPAVVLSAHIDTVGFSPGADDNGSGIALLLYLAKLITKMHFSFDIYFVFTNAEEIGLFGAYQVANWFKTRQIPILININIDMILYNPPNILFNEIGGNRMGEYYAKILSVYSKNFDDGAISVNVSNELWQRGDQYAFFLNGFPAISISESQNNEDLAINPYYHTEDDVIDAIGYDYQNPLRIMRAIVLAFVDWSKSIEWGDLGIFHYYSKNISSINDELEAIIIDDSLAIIKVSCEACELSINKLNNHSVTSNNNLTIYLKKGQYNFSIDEDVAKIDLYLGSDINNNSKIDVFELENQLDKTVDTDGDNLTDYDEIFVIQTSPIQNDSDKDGLLDPDEIVLQTDPWNSDTDNDGYEDGEEIIKGSDPLDLSSFPSTIISQTVSIKSSNDSTSSYSSTSTSTTSGSLFIGLILPILVFGLFNQRKKKNY